MKKNLRHTLPLLALALGIAAGCHTFALTTATSQPATHPAVCMVRYVPERADDIFWENDRTAHRIYGPALATDPKGPPMIGSGIDVWCKSVRTLMMDKALKHGDYHHDHGEGVDCYETHTTRGCGGLAIWDDDKHKLFASANWASYKILQNGPDVAQFSVDYADWDAGNDRTVKEHRIFTLPAGTNFTRIESTLDSNKPGELLVAIGIIKRKIDGKNFSGQDHLIEDKDTGVFAYWEPEQKNFGHVGTAVRLDPATIVKFVNDDPTQNLVIVRQTAGKPFVYYIGACWSKGLDFHTSDEWEKYVKDFKPDFKPQ